MSPFVLSIRASVWLANEVLVSHGETNGLTRIHYVAICLGGIARLTSSNNKVNKENGFPHGNPPLHDT
ncbi:hypothetical protein CDAR_170541 [Caerostris darwini]|uniref:Uncharacterized protein n=1 Tax=Caerostris darwini TaxID=1538125 RepID=A0AAV4R3Z9_9ARAC|nr:hypothetical protein CDAR_170541 [Caerostris darwini]